MASVTRVGFAFGDGLRRSLKLARRCAFAELDGADAEDALEAAEDGEARDAGRPGHVGEPCPFGGVPGEELGDGGDGLGLRIGSGRGEVGLAAHAGAVACGLGQRRRRKEGDVFARGPAAGAAGAAEDVRRPNRIHELAVGGGVAREHLLPGLAGKDAGDPGGGSLRLCNRRRDVGVGDRCGHGGLHTQYPPASRLSRHSER